MANDNSFLRSVDATAASLSDGEMKEVCPTSALSGALHSGVRTALGKRSGMACSENAGAVAEFDYDT